MLNVQQHKHYNLFQHGKLSFVFLNAHPTDIKVLRHCILHETNPGNDAKTAATKAGVCESVFGGISGEPKLAMEVV